MSGELVFGYVLVICCFAVVVLCRVNCLVVHRVGYFSVAV